MKLNLKVLPLIALAAALGTTGAFAQAPPQAPAAMQHSGMDMKNMKSQIEQMRAQMGSGANPSLRRDRLSSA
jgi:hypothetical protein